MRVNALLYKAIILITAIVFSYSSMASIVINATRVIYSSDQKEALVNMTNQGEQPLLVQSWIDDGHEGGDPQMLNLPFIASPPISRVDPGQGLTVRLNWDGQPLPADRESVYWFNALEIPGKNKDAAASNQLQIALKTRIKLFYRPRSLPGSAEDAIKNLQWSLTAENGNVHATAKNNTPYFVSLDTASVKVAGQTYTVKTDMVSPFGSGSFPVKALKSTALQSVTWSAINDYGGRVENTTK